MEMIGKVLGNRYEIIEKIGTGGMATVYKAKCRVLNRFVAVKILKDEFANDSEFIKRFQVEAQAAASLSHPNIVSIFDVGDDNGMHYIVMELIEGKTLKDIINEKGKLPWKDAVKVTAQIASGLSQAHKNHIVHRDIKPHNILITKDGVAKVTDFGIAKAVSNSTINAFGSTIGSVHYFSPEHARGGYTDEKSDIYSLGVVLYEMCTGQLPFDGETPVAVALKHLQETPTEPMKLNSNIPEGLNAVIMKAMQKETSNRYNSASEMYEDLMKLLKNPNDTSAKTAGYSNSEFPTQKIPVIGITNTKDEVNKKNTIEQDDDNMGKSKKRVTKKMAMVRLLVILAIGVALFFVCVEAGKFISTMILGTNTVVEVPNIIGYSKEEAEQILTDLGLKLEVEANIESDEYPEGYIVYQSQAEGYELKTGATVGVRVSKGTNKVTVPDVTSLSSTTAAKMQIEIAGLVYKEEFEYHEIVSSGDIIRQEPEVNEEVSKGSEVTVYISKGPASGDSGFVLIPSVIGLKEDEARQVLIEKNLIPKVTYLSTSSKEPGIVIGQTPEDGSYKTELSEVVLVVSTMPGSGTEDSGDSGKSSSEQTGNNDGDDENLVAKKEVKINLESATKSRFNLKVVLEGTTVGKRVEYDAEHRRGDQVSVYVTNEPGAIVRIYIDDELTSEMPL